MYEIIIEGLCIDTYTHRVSYICDTMLRVGCLLVTHQILECRESVEHWRGDLEGELIARKPQRLKFSKLAYTERELLEIVVIKPE